MLSIQIFNIPPFARARINAAGIPKRTAHDDGSEKLLSPMHTRSKIAFIKELRANKLVTEFFFLFDSEA